MNTVQSLGVSPQQVVFQKAIQIKEKILQLEHISLAMKVASCFRFTANATKELFGVSRSQYLFGGLKLFALAEIPLKINSIGSTIFNVCKTTISEKIDAALNIIGSIGTISDSINTIAEGLLSFKFVVAQVIEPLASLTIIGTILELAYLILLTKNFVETTRFAKNLKNEAALGKSVEDYTVEDYRKGLDFIDKAQLKEKSTVSKYFDIDKEKFADRLVDIEFIAKEKIASNDPSEVLEGKQLLHSTMEALIKRCAIKKRILVINAISAIVSTIGLGILLFTPIAPAGFTLMAVGTGIAIGGFVYHKVMTAKFEKELQLT